LICLVAAVTKYKMQRMTIGHKWMTKSYADVEKLSCRVCSVYILILLIAKKQRTYRVL